MILCVSNQLFDTENSKVTMEVFCDARMIIFQFSIIIFIPKSVQKTGHIFFEIEASKPDAKIPFFKLKYYVKVKKLTYFWHI